MIVQGKKCKYQVQWQKRGFTFAIPIVRIKVKYCFCGFEFFSRWKKVWDGEDEAKCIIDARCMHPHAMRRWFEKSVDKYEAYQEAWSN